ncbi:hypothetical protein [Risungbinella massiliensis]|uniref:hypothetical protein n=1 Tax=Risungbinella massiliensis TaxID=1329796 RepID=UPI0005CBFADA|nr:hypothetical protein [Risungbinella massiliensis]
MTEKNTGKLVRYFLDKVEEFSTNNRRLLKYEEYLEMSKVWEAIKSGQIHTKQKVDQELARLTDKWSNKGKSVLNYINDYYQYRRD